MTSYILSKYLRELTEISLSFHLFKNKGDNHENGIVFDLIIGFPINAYEYDLGLHSKFILTYSDPKIFDDIVPCKPTPT